MKDRILKHWETTLIGCILFVASLVALFMNIATLTEIGLILPTIILLLRAKSTLIGITK